MWRLKRSAPPWRTRRRLPSFEWRIGVITRLRCSITIPGAYVPGMMRRSRASGRVRCRSASLSFAQAILFVAMLRSSSVFFVDFVLSVRSTSASRLCWRKSSCSSSAVCVAFHASMASAITRIAGVGSRRKASSIALVVFSPSRRGRARRTAPRIHGCRSPHRSGAHSPDRPAGPRPSSTPTPSPVVTADADRAPQARRCGSLRIDAGESADERATTKKRIAPGFRMTMPSSACRNSAAMADSEPQPTLAGIGCG